MGPAVVTVRAVQPGDHDRLRDLTFESKAHCGYDREFGFLRTHVAEWGSEGRWYGMEP